MRARTGPGRGKGPLAPVPSSRDAHGQAPDLIGGRNPDRVINAVATGCAP